MCAFYHCYAEESNQDCIFQPWTVIKYSILFAYKIIWKIIEILQRFKLFWRQPTNIDENWRQLTQINIDASVNFRRFSSIFVNKIFQNFKILKNVKKRQNSSINVRDVIKYQNSSLLTRQVIWRQLTSMKTTKWRLTSCWRSSIDVKKCQLTSIVAWRYHNYIIL